MLRGVAERIKASLRSGDSLGRYGGDEFASLFPDTSAPKAREIDDRLGLAVHDFSIATPFGKAAAIVSLGIALFDIHCSDPDSLLAHSDQALYRAKRAGRNRVSVCDVTGSLAAGDQHPSDLLSSWRQMTG